MNDLIKEMINDRKTVKSLISGQLKESGTTLSDLKDKGRFYLGGLKKDGNEYVLKIAKTKKESINLQNDTQFSEQLKKLDTPFEVPTIEVSGFIFKDFYYKVESKINGKPLAELKESISILNINKPEKHFKNIIEMILWLQDQEIVVPRDIEKKLSKSDKYNNEKVLKAMVKWSYNSTPRLSDILKIVLKNELVFKKVTSHRDITPINIIITQDKNIALIDHEISKMAPKYYDIAEFYNRLWTRVCKPELAKNFLELVIQNLKDDKIKFYNQFLVISSFRAVGNYWEAMQLRKNQKKRLKYAKSYIHHIVNSKFLLE